MIVYRCRNCGFILEVVTPGRTLDDSVSAVAVAAGYARCPRCGAKLNPEPRLNDIVVRTAEYARSVEREAREQILRAITITLAVGRR